MKKFANLSALIECSTGCTPTVPAMRRMIRMLADMGYDTLYLGLTDGYKIPEYPYFNYKRGGYTTADLCELDECAKNAGIELCANIQTLGHLDFLARHESFRDLMDTPSVLMVGDERVYELVDRMFAAISAGLSSRRIHIGFDEVWGLGTGNYLKRNGQADKKALLLSHLLRVLKIAEKYGYTCEIWHDMLIEKDGTTVTAADVRAALPDNVRVWYWDYWEKDEAALDAKLTDMKKYADRLGYAGTAFKCGSMAPINTFSIARLIPEMKVSAAHGLDSFMVTLWSDNGAWVNNFTVLPAVYAAAEYARGAWNGEGEPDKARFRAITGGDYDALLSLDCLDDVFDNRPTDWHGNRSFWITLTDLLNGGWDLMPDAATEEAYLTLSERYNAAARDGSGGDFDYLFTCAAAFARVLGLKCTLGRDIRAAYGRGDKDALRVCLDRLAALRQAWEDYLPIYEETWLHDNMVFGLEVDQLFLGGQLARFDSIARRLRAYIDRDQPVAELDSPTLPPDVPPCTNAESFWNSDWKQLWSNCGCV